MTVATLLRHDSAAVAVNPLFWQKCRKTNVLLRLRRVVTAFAGGPLSPCDRAATAAKMGPVGIKRVNKMAKNIQSKESAATRSKSATKPLAHTRAAEQRPAEKKKVRRAIFKTDQWYESAAMSIGIAARAKGVRPGVTATVTVTARSKDE